MKIIQNLILSTLLLTQLALSEEKCENTKTSGEFIDAESLAKQIGDNNKPKPETPEKEDEVKTETPDNSIVNNDENTKLTNPEIISLLKENLKENTDSKQKPQSENVVQNEVTQENEDYEELIDTGIREDANERDRNFDLGNTTGNEEEIYSGGGGSGPGFASPLPAPIDLAPHSLQTGTLAVQNPSIQDNKKNDIKRDEQKDSSEQSKNNEQISNTNVPQRIVANLQSTSNNRRSIASTESTSPKLSTKGCKNPVQVLPPHPTQSHGILTYLEYYYLYIFITKGSFPQDGLFSTQKLNKIKLHATLYEPLDLSKKPKLSVGDLLIEMENNRDFNEHIFIVDDYINKKNTHRSVASESYGLFMVKSLDGTRKIRKSEKYKVNFSISPPELFALRVKNNPIVKCE